MNIAQKKFKKYKTKEIWRIILFLILLLVGLGGIIYAGITQMILCYQKFGVIISSDVLFIPHISLLGYLGVIPLSVCWIFLN